MSGLDGLACHDSANPCAVILVEIVPVRVDFCLANVVRVAAAASRRKSSLLNNSVAVTAALARNLV